ncbi:hypothetical protein CA833_02285 [Novosphingobium sp. KA1]|nr:hypothetical protein CA833_02285 [Novosphingobium sp. KA1]
MHRKAHPLAGQAVVVASGTYEGQVFEIEDWWDRVAGESWIDCDENPVCVEYAMRAGADFDPLDDEVVLGHLGDLEAIMHARHLPTPAAQDRARRKRRAGAGWLNKHLADRSLQGEFA